MLRGRLTINERYALELAQGYERRSGQTSGLENPARWLLELLNGHESHSGVAVNDESALSYAAVYACCRILSDSIASLPISLRRKLPDGGSEIADRRPEHRLMAVSPSDLYTSFTFRSTAQLHLGLRGNAYARIMRDGRYGARELRLLHPAHVRPFTHNGSLYYDVTPDHNGLNGTERMVLGPDDVLHIVGLSSDGLCGKSPITVLRDTIGMGIANRNNVAKLQKRGRLEGYLRHPNKLNADQVTGIRDNFKTPLKNGEFPLLENGVEFQSISLSPHDAEFINTHKLTSRDIFSAYRIPPHMAGDLERATFSNIEHQALEFVKFTLLPWIRNWEQELNRKLLPTDLQSDHYFHFNVDGLLRGDFKTRMEGYVRAIQWGMLNRDEVRALEDLNPIPDGFGQVYLTPLNMAPIEQIDQHNGSSTSDLNNGNGQQSGTAGSAQ